MYAGFFLIATIIFVIDAGLICSTSFPLTVAFSICGGLCACACFFNALNGK